MSTSGTGQAGRYQRSFSGLIGSMVVLLVVVGAYVAFRAVNRTEPADPVRPVEWERSVDYARDQADFDLLAPDELPTGWIATSVRYTGGRDPHWHLGMLTGQRQYVGLEQEDRSAEDMVADYVDAEAQQGEDVEIGGQTWESWFDAEDQALVLEGEDVTTLVVGTVPQETVVDFVASLGTAPPS